MKDTFETYVQMGQVKARIINKISKSLLNGHRTELDRASWPCNGRVARPGCNVTWNGELILAPQHGGASGLPSDMPDIETSLYPEGMSLEDIVEKELSEVV